MLKIAIASGKGGTGKTFLSSNLFQTLRHSGISAVLVDCDAEVPNGRIFFPFRQVAERAVRILSPEIEPDRCSFCGLCADWCSSHAITCIPAARYIRIMPDICHGCGACLHVCGQDAIRPLRRETGRVTAFCAGDGEAPCLFEAKTKEGVHSPVPVIREAVAWGMESGAEVLVMDAPPGCACPFVNTVMEADRVILVTEPTPFGLSDLKHTVQVLRRLGKDFAVVLNRADLGDSGMKDWLEEENISLIGEIPYSENIASAYAKGELAVDADPALRDMFTGLMQVIVGPAPNRNLS